MREQLETLVSAGKIGRQDIEPLLTLLECGYCQHRGWGFGKIKEMDPVFGRFVIDFADKPGHGMDLSFAVKTLQPVPKDHILARKSEDLAGLRQLAAKSHKDVVALVLQSYGGQATVDQVQSVLVPDVIDEDWRKWWDVARRELKTDGHFQVPLKKTQPIVYQAQIVPLEQRLREEFTAARGLKARLVVASELLKCLPDIPEPAALVGEVLPLLNSEINSHQRTQPPLAIEAILMRDELAQTVSAPPLPDQIDAGAVWAQVDDPAMVLDAISAPKHGRALQSFKAARAADWHEALLAILNDVSARLCGECVRLLREDHLDVLKDYLRRLISQHGASTELLLWLAKERSDLYADVLGPEVFRAMLTAIERDQFNEKKSSRLQDFVMDDGDLLPDLIQSADIEVVKDLTRALQFSSGFDDVDRRSLLARIVKLFPAVQSLISGDQSRQENPLVVSWVSLQRRKAEYQELVEKKIPANSHDIAVARSYGDLRENHEYKAAKEMHRLLMQRKAELERDLGRAQGSDFKNPRTDAVGVGTRVRVTELAAQREEVFNILGAWDFDPETHIISYLSPVAQALMGKKPGDETSLELEGHQARYRIESIEVCPLDPPGTQPADEAGETGEPVGTAPAPTTDPGTIEDGPPNVAAGAVEAGAPAAAEFAGESDRPVMEPVPPPAPPADEPVAPSEQTPGVPAEGSEPPSRPGDLPA